MSDQPLYILMLSLHGLIRGQNLELGRDADTGGQTTYVVELARALGRNPDVDRLDLVTRLIEDPALSADYAQPLEILNEGARIVRLPFGPKRYLRKESLWVHLDSLVDRCLHWLRQQGRLPDVIHTHYADAGYVGLQLSTVLGVPLIHTGHSLGRCKKARLIAAGRKEQALDRQFHFPRRIEAEEAVLEHASLVVTSTRQEISDQYGMYENFRRSSAAVIPPGTNTSRFSPPGRHASADQARALVDRFLEEPGKPMILAICRPDTRKNLQRLLTAYGEDPALREAANLVIIAGNRDDIRQMEEAQASVLMDLILAVDRYDLYGKVALPKQHRPEDVPELYRLAARRRGVFVNAALTEPFGLTLIEAAASGLPIVATEDGGPQDIVANCRNGLLVDPLNTVEIASAIKDALSDRDRWRKWSKNGISGVRRHYSWDAHVAKYMKAVRQRLRRYRKQIRRDVALSLDQGTSLLPFARHVLVSDIDNTLIGDRASLPPLLNWIQKRGTSLAFGIATGRTVDSAVRALREWQVPTPDILITSVGSEIHYGVKLAPDAGWRNHIRYKWRRDALVEALAQIPGLRLQGREHQREFKLSYYVHPARMPPLESVQRLLKRLDLHANLIYSHGAFLDVLPLRASKGHAIRYLAYKWGLPLRHFLVAGDSGNDAEMLVGDTLGVVVGNHSPELQPLQGLEQIYFADATHAAGILEGIRHYGFAGETEPYAEEAAHD